MRPADAQANASSSPVDDDGVRVVATRAATEGRGTLRLFLALVAGLALAVVVGWKPIDPPAAAPQHSQSADTMPAPVPNALPEAAATRRDAPALTEALVERLASPPSNSDPNDLATYFREGDDVPDTANLIRALNEAGITSGIAAFNPPGTSPPLEGLAVPDDFDLPPGYVRHHQATDEGEPLPPILMFAPDLVWRDAQGRVIPLPANRVVPREMAPPGLPVRWVRPGSP